MKIYITFRVIERRKEGELIEINKNELFISHFFIVMSMRYNSLMLDGLKHLQLLI